MGHEETATVFLVGGNHNTEAMLRRVFWRRPERRTKEAVPSDRDLASRLRERLVGELPEAGHNRLRFYVRDGAVTIYGSVRSLDDRRFVNQLARRTAGVETVYDHLTIES